MLRRPPIRRSPRASRRTARDESHFQPLEPRLQLAVGYTIDGPDLIRFDTDHAYATREPLVITGLGAGESLVNLDFSHIDGSLIGLVWNAANEFRLCTVEVGATTAECAPYGPSVSSGLGSLPNYTAFDLYETREVVGGVTTIVSEARIGVGDGTLYTISTDGSGSGTAIGGPYWGSLSRELAYVPSLDPSTIRGLTFDRGLHELMWEDGHFFSSRFFYDVFGLDITSSGTAFVLEDDLHLGRLWSVNTSDGSYTFLDYLYGNHTPYLRGLAIAPEFPPVLTGLSNVAVNDDETVKPFESASVAYDVDSSETLTATVSLDAAAKGVFTQTSLNASGFSETSSGSGVYTRTGTAAELTAALQALVFRPVNARVLPTLTETTTLTLKVENQAHTSAQATVDVVATAVYDGPELSGVTDGDSLETDDDQSIALFPVITLINPDNPLGVLTATISLDAPAKGAFTGASLSASGFSETSSGSGVYTRTGTAAELNTALSALRFDPADNRVAPGQTETTTLTLKIADGIGDDFQRVISVVSTSVYDAPTLTGLPTGPLAITEHQSTKPFLGASIVNPEQPSALTITVTLDDAAKGVFTPASLESTGFTQSAPGVYTLQADTAEAAAAALAGLVFDPAASRVLIGQTETTGFTVAIDTGFGTPAEVSGPQVVSTAVYDQPVLSGISPDPFAIDDNQTVVPFPQVSLGNPDAADAVLTATVTLDAAKGALTPASLDESGFELTSPGVYTRTGAAAELTAALRALRFDPVNNRVAVGQTETTAISLSVEDGVGDPLTGSAEVVSTSVYDAPTITGLSKAKGVIGERDRALPFANAVITAPDATGDITVTVTFDAAKGMFSIASMKSSGFTRTGPGVYAFTGGVKAATLALRTLAFNPGNNRVARNKIETTAFTVSVDDGQGPAVENSSATVRANSDTGTAQIQGAGTMRTKASRAVAPFRDVTINHPSLSEELTVRVSINRLATGSFTAQSLSEAGFVQIKPATWQFAGTAAQATEALRALRFQPAEGIRTKKNVTTQFTIWIGDGEGPNVQDTATRVVRKAA